MSSQNAERLTQPLNENQPPLAGVTHNSNIGRPTNIQTRLLKESPPILLRDWLSIGLSKEDARAVELVGKARPKSLRKFDQIPMRPQALLKQVKLMIPYLANKSVVFMGDADYASLLIGMISRNYESTAKPKQMMLLDFDERLLDAACEFAHKYQFFDLLDARLYNAFDCVPMSLLGRYDWFYTNPPYGSNNLGESIRLFINRGCELTVPGGSGCIIIPNDAQRPWTLEGLLKTQEYLIRQGWVISEGLAQLHNYQLDDDKDLTSSLFLVKDVEARPDRSAMTYSSRNVDRKEIPMFYGRNVAQPYPRYIRSNGSYDINWSA